MRQFLSVCTFIAWAWCLSPAPAQAATAEQCAALGRADMTDIVGAPSQLSDSRMVPAAGDQPSYCRVRGATWHDAGFEMHLPVGNWNGKFLQSGCAGFCGRKMSWYCRDATARGYACIVTDMGHRSAEESPGSPSLNGLWAYQNDSAQIDHGFRAVHTATLVGKALTQRFYGERPKYSYFNGCSEGGREALVAAQKYPWDFDGIIAGAPAMDMGRLFMSQIWNARQLKGVDGKPLMSVATLKVVQDAVVNKCDMNDGIADGVIGDPRQCKFNPSELLCKNGDSASCISPPQADALSALMSGPKTKGGDLLTPGGLSPSVNWLRLLAPGTAGRTTQESYGEEFFRYQGFSPAPGQNWSREEFDFEQDYKRTGTIDALMSNTNPDLRRFQKAGGRLILYHGWDDHLISPYMTVDYYDLVRSAMGVESASSFSRLFMVPGMDHCALGGGAWSIDFLSYLEQWVEKGEAPASVTGANPKLPSDPVQAFAKIGRFPVEAAETNFVRSVYAYPSATQYDSKGHAKPGSVLQPKRRVAR